MKIESVAVDDLVLDPANARKHSGKNLDAIAGSLREFGQRKPIVVTADGVVVAGNGTLEAARSLGWERIDVVRVPGDWSADQVKAFALADNRTAELAEWNPEVLSAQLLDLEQTGFDIEAIGFDLSNENVDDEIDASIPDVKVEPRTRVGDMWQIGKHRILCGDSFDDKAHQKLTDGLLPSAILTDPPYGIDLDTHWKAGGGRDYKPIANDNKAFDASWLKNKYEYCSEQFWWGANYFQRTLLVNDLDGSWLVWDKRTENTDSVIGSGFELCWSRQKHKQDLLRYHWTNFVSHSNDGHKRIHPTEKPVAMLIEIIRRWIPDDAVVIDFFAGSGSTLMACAKTNRVGLGIELDPEYVDEIVARLEAITGEQAVKL